LAISSLLFFGHVHTNEAVFVDRYPKLKIYIPEVTLDSYEYIPAA